MKLGKAYIMGIQYTKRNSRLALSIFSACHTVTDWVYQEVNSETEVQGIN